MAKEMVNTMKKKTREYLGEVKQTNKWQMCSSEQEQIEASRAYSETKRTTNLNLDEILALMDQ